MKEYKKILFQKLMKILLKKFKKNKLNYRETLIHLKLLKKVLMNFKIMKKLIKINILIHMKHLNIKIMI
jgi:hypothetical protein